MIHGRIAGLILLFIQPAFATKGGPAVGDGGTVISVTLTTTSGTTVTIPTNGTATQSSIKPAITSSAPLITIPIIPNATTCMPMTFTWQVTPSTFNTTDLDVRLTVTNNDVGQPTPQPSTFTSGQGWSSPANITTRCITNNTALSSGFYNWSAVTVPPGWYMLDIWPIMDSSHSISDLAAHSEKFFVMAGLNTSCVFSNVSTFPAQSNSHFTSGALAGTVVGSVVGAAALIAAFVLPRLWRRGVPGHEAWKEKRGLYKVF